MEVLTFMNKLIIALFSIVLISCIDSEEVIRNANKLENGMSKKEVIEIMGEPNRIDSVTAFDPFVERFYYKVYNIEALSDRIIVWFDSTGKLGQVSFPKGIK